MGASSCFSSMMDKVLGFPSKSVFLLVLALVLTSLQCVAFCSAKPCVADDVPKAPPPCHHSDKAPANNVPATCGHELILADTAQAPIVHAFTFDTSNESIIPGINSPLSTVLISEARGQAFCPPGLTALASTVLRI